MFNNLICLLIERKKWKIFKVILIFIILYFFLNFQFVIGKFFVKHVFWIIFLYAWHLFCFIKLFNICLLFSNILIWKFNIFKHFSLTNALHFSLISILGLNLTNFVFFCCLFKIFVVLEILCYLIFREKELSGVLIVRLKFIV